MNTTEIIWNGTIYDFKAIVSRVQALSKIYIKTVERLPLPGFEPCIDPLTELRTSARRVVYGSAKLQEQLVEVITSLSADGKRVDVEDTALFVIDAFSNTDIMDRARLVRRADGTLRLTLLRTLCPKDQRACVHIPMGKKTKAS